MRNDECWYKEVCESECSNCIRYLEMKFLFDNSNIPRNRQFNNKLSPDDEDFDSFCRLADIKDNIETLVNNGYNLYITSKETGNGKTSWSIKLMLKYFSMIWPGNGFKVRGLFVHTPTLLSKLKDFENPMPQDQKELLNSVDLIIWDDIASTSLSGYDLSQLLIYVDNRIFNGKANIFNGNIPSKSGLSKNLGERLASRIWNCSEVIIFEGKDKRGLKN